MYPLVLCSLAIWGVIFERILRFRKLEHRMKAFHLEALNSILRKDGDTLKALCKIHPDLPNSQLLETAIDRMTSKDPHLRARWVEAVQRRRQLVNQDLRRYLWILGTIANAAPFIGLFGTVVGILRSFADIAQTGKGGFAVVASGISEALIATAAGIIVAVVAALAFNAFQNRWSALVLSVKLYS